MIKYSWWFSWSQPLSIFSWIFDDLFDALTFLDTYFDISYSSYLSLPCYLSFNTMLRNLGAVIWVISLTLTIACDYFLLLLIKVFFNLVIIMFLSSNNYQKNKEQWNKRTQYIGNHPGPKPLPMRGKPTIILLSL